MLHFKPQSRLFSTCTLQSQLIRASFLHAKTEGFTDAAITSACRDLGYQSTTGAVLERGSYDVVSFAMDHWFSAMKDDLTAYKETVAGSDDLHFKDLETSKQLRVGVQTRLTLMSPYIKSWPQAMVLGMKP